MNTHPAPSTDPYALIPADLKQRPQWVIFTLDTPDATGKCRKIPLNPANGRHGSDKDPGIWLAYSAAVVLEQSTPAHFRNRVDGIGYVFLASDPYVGIDLDDCYHGGKLDDRAATVVQALNSYTEVSISGRGVKAIVRAVLVENPSLAKGVEIYGHSRFFALTGKHLAPSPQTINHADTVVSGLIQDYAHDTSPPSPAPRSDPHPPHQQGSITDNPIVAYNQRMDVFAIVERNGGAAESRKLYHCPCGIHRGLSASLQVKKSDKYGAVVRGLNPACVFYGRDSAAFDVMKHLEHRGDMSGAIKAARGELAMPIQFDRRSLCFSPKQPAPAAARIVDDVPTVMRAVLATAARDESLRKSERRVLNCLIDHAPNGIARLTVAQIVALTSESESSVQRATRRLNRYFAKYEDATAHGGNVANVYQFIKIVTPPPCFAPDFLPENGKKHDFDTPLLLIEREGGDYIDHDLKINHGATFEQNTEIPQPEQNQVAPAIAPAPPLLSFPESAEPTESAKPPTTLPSAIRTILETSAQRVNPETGEITHQKWTIKRVTAELAQAYGDCWPAPMIAQTYTAVRKAQNTAAFTDYRKRVQAMPTAALVKEASKKRTTATRSAGNPREAYHRAMDAIAHQELASRPDRLQPTLKPKAAKQGQSPAAALNNPPAGVVPIDPIDPPNAMLNTAAALIAAGEFGDYESLKKQHSRYDWGATDSRYSYRVWRAAHMPAAAPALIERENRPFHMALV